MEPVRCYDCGKPLDIGVRVGRIGQEFERWAQEQPETKAGRPLLATATAFHAAYVKGYRAGQLAMRERAAQEACHRCERGEPVQEIDGTWMHGDRECGAGTIRALEPEEPK